MQVALSAARHLQEEQPEESGFGDIEEITLQEVIEGKEPKEFFEGEYLLTSFDSYIFILLIMYLMGELAQ